MSRNIYNHVRLSIIKKFCAFDRIKDSVSKEVFENRKVEEITNFIKLFGVEECMKVGAFAKDLIDNNFYINIKIDKDYNTLKDMIFNSDINFYKYIKTFEKADLITYANNAGLTLGHYLAEQYKLADDKDCERSKNIYKAIKLYTTNPRLAKLQTKKGNTIGHILAKYDDIANDYIQNAELYTIKNSKGYTVGDLNKELNNKTCPYFKK